VAKTKSWYILTFSYVIKSGDSTRGVCGWYDAHPKEYEQTLGRMMNHSRENPNLIDRFFKGQPRLIFETLRPINKGEELLWDYGDKGLDAPEWLRV
jgi:SET domain-containing protein